jgi:glycosyltransferase involved in cell wall biosynthesis
MDAENVKYSVNDIFIIHKIGLGKTSYQYQPLLLDWLKKNGLNYDVIIVHGLWQYHNVAVNKSINFLKKHNSKVPKVMIMPHGMLDPYFQKAPDRKFKALRNEIIWKYIEKKCVNEADAIFYTCQEEMKLAATTFKGYNPKKEINIGYGIQAPPIDIPEFKDAFFKLCPDVKGKEYWLFLSRIHEKKGVDLLIKAYDELSKQNSTLPELVIAGPNKSEYAQQMIQLASENSKIHFTGMLQGNEKWGAFYNCQVYLLPSHQENFGIAIVEAMSCKKPVLITKNVNIWKDIYDGDGGYILDDLNVISLKKKLSELSCDFEILKKGSNALTLFKKKFDVNECAKVLVDVLKKMY